MTSYSGVIKIVRFNWPWYAFAAAATFAVLLGLFLNVFHGMASALVVAAMMVADLWVLLSLTVSHYVYDLSAVSRGAWLDNIDATKIRRAAIFHAGQDEGSPKVVHLLPSIDFEVFDFYDEQRNGTRSLKRARALNQRRDLQMRSDKIPVGDSTFDLALVIFAAHEIRDDSERAMFFGEVRRVLAPLGRVIVVEHMRDIWNFLAYGPGAFHFLSEQTWRRSFGTADLQINCDRRCTRFVRVFELGRTS